MSCVVYLISFEDETAYVGSTKDLQKRMNNHRYAASKEDYKEYEKPLYFKMRECAYGVSVLEETTDEERYNCEQKWIEDLKPDLNAKSATAVLSREEYKKKYDEDHREEYKQYYQANKEKIRAYQNENIVCDCGAIISRHNIARHKLSKKHLSNI